MARSLQLRLSVEASPVVNKIAEVFKRQVSERSGVQMGPSRPAELVIALEISPGIGAEGFAIEDGPHGEIVIRGNDERGLLYGVGKFLRGARYAPGAFTPGTWRGVSLPKKPVRGIYFATHFHNVYHDAPLESVQRYVEELALWGTNVVCIWFDMHHFTGLEDPAAQAMIGRLKAILRAANEIGIGAGLTFIANEAYADSPVDLRADWTAGHDGYHHPPQGHYHVELCPNRPGAKDLMLRWVEEKFAAFADIAIDYLWIWPYDQGGCTCWQCKPWGMNGFLTMAEPIARRFRRAFPHGKVVLSTWYFDHFTDGEWEGLSKAFATRPDWVDYLLADDYGDRFPQYPLVHGAPGGFPMVNFPEISMYGSGGYGPWGGFGANPLPHHLQALWDSAKRSLSGGFPYSEGIYEDINKAICAQFYWSPDKPAMETVREYVAFEYSPEVVESVNAAIEVLERTLPRVGHATEPVSRFVIRQPAGIEEAYQRLQEVDAQLSPYARQAWRWRILYLRALIDYELARHDFAVSERCEEAFEELTAIYHAQNAAYWVAPPTRAAIRARRGG
jgi:hypothetical protein